MIRARLSAPRARLEQDNGVSIIDACADPLLFGPWFKDRANWAAWFTFLRALFALPMSEEQLAFFRRCTGRKTAPKVAAREGWLICGRRAGKSFILALIATFLACFHSFEEFLAPGEKATVLVIAADRKQARIILRFIRALLKEVALLRRMIVRETADGFELSNSVVIEVGTSSFRSVRGYTIAAALLDEAAFWNSDEASANPDNEILRALRPAMSTIPTAMLLVASSPYAKRGILWDAFKLHHGKDRDPVLTWQAGTKLMNPTIPQSHIDKEYRDDPASASAEYGAQFRNDIEQFIGLDAVEACVAKGIRERPPVNGI